jgi:predicted CoA-binding protein
MQNNDYKTLILGASTNPARASYAAASKFEKADIEWIPIGLRDGDIFGKAILDLREMPDIRDLDTITLYINPANQIQWYDYILSLKPRRVIFNPGTENPELYRLLKENSIIPEVACTLVLLTMDNYKD